MDFVPEYAYRQLEKDNESLRKQIRAMEGVAGKRKQKTIGRNNLKKVDWSPIDVDNECTINDYCRKMVYPFYKYLPKGWQIYNEAIKNNLSTRVMKRIYVPPALTRKYYWGEKVMPLMNKKFIDMRSNDRGVCHKQFKSMSIENMLYFDAPTYSCYYSNLIVICHHFLYPTKEDYPTRRPNTTKLAEGPSAFGCLDITGNDDPQDMALTATPLFDFIGNYVGKTYGINSINKWLKENKGLSFLDKMTVDDLVHCITMVKNHENSWERGIMISQLNDPLEEEKYENYQDIDDPQEREKYSPIAPMFSAGRGIKRQFGAVMWDDEGKAFYEKTKET